jgi:hypothetical protein
MTKYIWGAGDGRLSHLSLMRASPAARRYARRTLYPVVLVGAICWFALTGWHGVKAISVEAGGQARQPTGSGWYALATAPLEVGEATSNPSRITAWWWNPPLAFLGSLAALVWGYILYRLLLAIVRVGVERSLLPRYRGQQRLSAAVYYAVAWSVPLVPAGLILILLPLCRLAEVSDWLIRPPTAFVYVPAAVLGGFAVFMGWFGLVRLAATVPVRARTRVFLFCGLWMPLIAAILTAASIWGLGWLQQTTAARLQLQW